MLQSQPSATTTTTTTFLGAAPPGRQRPPPARDVARWHARPSSSKVGGKKANKNAALAETFPRIPR